MENDIFDGFDDLLKQFREAGFREAGPLVCMACGSTQETKPDAAGKRLLCGHCRLKDALARVAGK
jgi:hypothetical protein